LYSSLSLIINLGDKELYLFSVAALVLWIVIVVCSGNNNSSDNIDRFTIKNFIFTALQKLINVFSTDVFYNFTFLWEIIMLIIIICFLYFK